MSELLVTQCPYCQTRFRLSQEQLNAAAGHVRCGACLKVFDARKVLAEPATEPEQPAAAPAQPTRVPQQSSLLIHDDLELDELDLEALGLDESIIEEINPSHSAPPELAPEPPIQPLTPPAPEPEYTAPSSEPNPSPAASQRFQPLVAERDDHGVFRPEHTRTAPADKPSVLTGEDDEQRNEPRFGEHLGLDDLDDEPLLLDDLPRPRRRRRHNGLWTALCVLALLGLLGQYVTYNFEALAHDDRSRPWIEQACLLAGCELPARVDISLIRSSNLLVRPHPEFPRAVAIDVILYNRASFAQPFPVLSMSFSDSQGRELANRRFRPEEYLAGELAGVTLMPSQTPIHVALDMLDPGPQAVNYQLDFHSP